MLPFAFSCPFFSQWATAARLPATTDPQDLVEVPVVGITEAVDRQDPAHQSCPRHRTRPIRAAKTFTR